jgi:hypothetical protein
MQTRVFCTCKCTCTSKLVFSFSFSFSFSFHMSSLLSPLLSCLVSCRVVSCRVVSCRLVSVTYPDQVQRWQGIDEIESVGCLKKATNLTTKQQSVTHIHTYRGINIQAETTTLTRTRIRITAAYHTCRTANRSTSTCHVIFRLNPSFA